MFCFAFKYQRNGKKKVLKLESKFWIFNNLCGRIVKRVLKMLQINLVNSENYKTYNS